MTATTPTCFLIAFSIVVLSAHVLAENEFVRSMNGMQGLRLKFQTKEQFLAVKFFFDHPQVEVLEDARNFREETWVLVTEQFLPEFKKFLDHWHINYDIFVEDVAKEVERDHYENEMARHRVRRRTDSTYSFDHYPNYNETESFLKYLAEKHSDIATLITIGESIEGKQIYGLKISSGGNNKRAILIDAGIHAREWIAPTTALYAINQLVVNKTNSRLFEKLDWYIIPCLNPDGYEYSHTTDRMWRKNRSVNPGFLCRGTDLNRNFGYKWMMTGASDDPCAPTYAGLNEFSEPEARALKNFVLKMNNTIELYLTLHSAAQALLYPWGYGTELPKNEHELRLVGELAIKYLTAVRGTPYRIGSPPDVLRAVAGSSADWVMAVGNAPLSYSIELPVDNATMRFNPPTSSIKPVGLETFEAFKLFAGYIDLKYHNSMFM